MRDRVDRTMRQELAIAPGSALWVAVSGGVDSMVLLHVLRELGHHCHVAHVDHGLRGAESDADRDFVEDHCLRNDIPFIARRVDVAAQADMTGMSTQMAARSLRYAWFNELVTEGPSVMALAHHADDAIETFFLGLIQGMGLHGWESIPPRSGAFVRPMLGIHREEILSYARANHIVWREDASNTDPGYLRNRIRHELLPELERWRPGTHRNLARNVKLFRELDQLAQDAVRVAVDGLSGHDDGTIRIPFERIAGSQAPALVLHHLLRAKGFHPDALERILVAIQFQRTGAIFLSGTHQVLVDRNELVIGTLPSVLPCWTIPAADVIPMDAPIRLITDPAMVPSDGVRVLRMDADRIAFPLELRPWRAGDRMRPSGLGGSKLISDILIDAKLPRDRKQRTYVLADADRILWLCGHREAEDLRGTGTGARVLLLEWSGP